mmetsp:Transcript_5341/g.11539  ORF Transcript_5341/g.11539 Transcript_5341/m.11539 type:complete len:358 (+) Transcript_5341:204-1277(+)
MAGDTVMLDSTGSEGGTVEGGNDIGVRISSLGGLGCFIWSIARASRSLVSLCVSPTNPIFSTSVPRHKRHPALLPAGVPPDGRGLLRPGFCRVGSINPRNMQAAASTATTRATTAATRKSCWESEAFGCTNGGLVGAVLVVVGWRATSWVPTTAVDNVTISTSPKPSCAPRNSPNRSVCSSSRSTPFTAAVSTEASLPSLATIQSARTTDCPSRRPGAPAPVVRCPHGAASGAAPTASRRRARWATSTRVTVTKVSPPRAAIMARAMAAATKGWSSVSSTAAADSPGITSSRRASTASWLSAEIGGAPDVELGAVAPSVTSTVATPMGSRSSMSATTCTTYVWASPCAGAMPDKKKV